MSQKAVIYLCVIVGSIIGGYIPSLWGAGFLSISSLIFSTIGGLIGIYIGLKL